MAMSGMGAASGMRRAMGRHRVRIFVLALLTGACLIGAAVAWATNTFSITAYFTPDKLGASTNISAKATFAYSTSVPVPISNFVAYGPAGLAFDVKGTGTCNKAVLENAGPSACPADSRIGFGGGMGVLELAREVIHEPFTLDFFLGPRENGHLVILIYVNASTPVSYQVVLTAREKQGPKPYGWGVTFEVPLIMTLPGASYAAAEKTYFTIGDRNVGYYERVHGRQKLVHVRGIVVPRTCHRGGFPYEVLITFEDGTTTTYRGAYPCPRR